MNNHPGAARLPLLIPGGDFETDAHNVHLDEFLRKARPCIRREGKAKTLPNADRKRFCISTTCDGIEGVLWLTVAEIRKELHAYTLRARLARLTTTVSSSAGSIGLGI